MRNGAKALTLVRRTGAERLADHMQRNLSKRLEEELTDWFQPGPIKPGMMHDQSMA
jgi:hypothetical protein